MYPLGQWLRRHLLPKFAQAILSARLCGGMAAAALVLRGRRSALQCVYRVFLQVLFVFVAVGGCDSLQRSWCSRGLWTFRLSPSLNAALLGVALELKFGYVLEFAMGLKLLVILCHSAFGLLAGFGKYGRNGWPVID